MGRTAKMDRLRFGICGCGMISRWHADSILEIEGCEIRGVADRNAGAAAGFAASYGVLAYGDMDEMLADPDIDIVCICTPSGTHAQLAIKCAEAGKHIIVEKPMAVTLAECDEMIAAAEKNSVIMTVISQLRFTHTVQSVRSAVGNGALGRVVCGDIYMKYYRSPQYYANSLWRGTRAMDGGGALMNQGVHGVDVLQHIMGPVKSVYGICRTLARDIETEDTAAAVLEYASGAIGVIEATTSVMPGSCRRVEINGTGGTIVMLEDSVVEWSVEGMTIPADILVRSSNMEAARDPSKINLDGHKNQISDMVRAVRCGGRPAIDGYEGKKPIRIITAIYESSASGRRIDIDV